MYLRLLPPSFLFSCQIETPAKYSLGQRWKLSIFKKSCQKCLTFWTGLHPQSLRQVLFVCIHHTAAALMLSAVNHNERSGHPVTLRSVFAISANSFFPTGHTQMKAIPAHAETTGYVSPTTTWNYILLGSAENVKGSHHQRANLYTNTHTSAREVSHLVCLCSRVTVVEMQAFRKTGTLASVLLCNHQHNDCVSLHKVPFRLMFTVCRSSQFVPASPILQFHLRQQCLFTFCFQLYKKRNIIINYRRPLLIWKIPVIVLVLPRS